MSNADGLSRQQCQQCGRKHDDPRPKRMLQSIRAVSIKLRWTALEFQTAQKADADLAQLLRSFELHAKSQLDGGECVVTCGPPLSPRLGQVILN
jgi:hypothetical protein